MQGDCYVRKHRSGLLLIIAFWILENEILVIEQTLYEMMEVINFPKGDEDHSHEIKKIDLLGGSWLDPTTVRETLIYSAERPKI